MSRLFLTLCLVTLVAAGAGVAGEKAWFDMNCEMCASMSAKPELMQSMHWEQHNISNGVVCITTVPEKHLAAYRAIHADMEKTGERLMKGEKLDLCGSCQALNACFAKGINEEYVETSNGDVWILTSDKPEVVTALHNWVKRNQEEMAKYKAEKG